MGERMLALTLWRPWDTAILALGKPVENRNWPPPAHLIGQRLALHSGKRFDEDGACTIVSLCHAQRSPSPSIVTAHLERAELVHSAIIGTVKLSRVLERGNLADMSDPLYGSPWFFGDFGWVCEEPFLLPEPVPCKGKQGLWSMPPDVEARVRAQDAAHVAHVRHDEVPRKSR